MTSLSPVSFYMYNLNFLTYHISSGEVMLSLTHLKFPPKICRHFPIFAQHHFLSVIKKSCTHTFSKIHLTSWTCMTSTPPRYSGPYTRTPAWRGGDRVRLPAEAPWLRVTPEGRPREDLLSHRGVPPTWVLRRLGGKYDHIFSAVRRVIGLFFAGWRRKDIVRDVLDVTLSPYLSVTQSHNPRGMGNISFM